METKLLLQSAVDGIFDFEVSHLGEMNEIQREMATWEKPWRKESLNHYANVGWSFLVEKEGELLGYVLAQPILFFNNWTQTVWVEHLSCVSPEVGAELMDVMIRWAKSKHMQKVIFNSASDNASFVREHFSGFQDGGYLHLSTTKLHEV